MPSIPLPENASLEHLRNQAKLVQDLIRAGDEGALAMVDEFHPRIGSAEAAAPGGFKRSDAQLIVARLYGFRSWNRLRDHLRLLDRFARPDPADRDPAEGADRFAALGCVSYAETDIHARLAAARQMLDEDPTLAGASLAAMATAGNHEGLAAQIEADPSLAAERCGPNDWEPILYCAYSRIDAPDRSLSTMDTARVLLGAGADPNAGFLWRGLVPPFTALAGAFGHGEQDQPPHPAGFALARLLLEAGADPNDGQALYNCGLAGSPRDDPSHLELLVEFGLGTDIDGPWYQRFGARLTSPAELLYDELEVAAHRGLPARMDFLVRLGLDLDRPVGRSGLTPAELAGRSGHSAVLAILDRAGVNTGPIDVDPDDADV
ncbi:MAG: ankyrin repeat domain-containing protein [Actinomycetota bacterium]